MKNLTCPAQLWIGPRALLETEATNFLKNQFCQNLSQNCVSCKSIEDNNFFSILRIKPANNNYNLADLGPVFNILAQQLNDEQKFYFVFSSAEKLGTICSAALLKSIEEPPRGYNFIFLTTSKEAIIPTISSRCVIQVFKGEFVADSFSILKFFMQPQTDKMNEFQKTLEREVLTDSNIPEILDYLLQFFKKKFIENIEVSNLRISGKLESVIELILSIQKRGITPGSSKITLKNLYLQIMTILV